jgi:hypothetical protein
VALYRYRPKGNRTPVNDPVLGHLCYEGVYDDPRCADDARFEEIKDEKPGKPAKQAAGSDDKTAAEKAPDAGAPAGA